MRKAGVDLLEKKKMMAPNYIGSFASIRWLRCLFLGIFFAAFFLPYQYETGGTATIFPIKSLQIYAEMPGIVENVRVESNTWLEKGTLIAELSSHRQLRDLEATKQAIIKTTEDLNVLLSTPSEEELALAKEQLIIAQLEYKYSIADKERMEPLYQEGTIPLVTYLDFKEQSDVDYQEVLMREANLKTIENQVNQHAIESAKAELMILQQDLIFYEEQLKRTRLTMPSNGRIITMDLGNLENKYLEEGDLFAEIENTDQVKVEISVPEPDIGQFSLGSHVSLKVFFLPNEIISGLVTSIFPQTSESEGGNVFKVISIIPNEDGLLQTGMTGYAKIRGKQMYLIEAFTRALIRFVLVETWSWLP